MLVVNVKTNHIYIYIIEVMICFLVRPKPDEISEAMGVYCVNHDNSFVTSIFSYLIRLGLVSSFLGVNFLIIIGIYPFLSQLKKSLS